MNESDPDLLGKIIERTQQRTSDRLELQMQEAQDIKDQEEVASQRRMEEMWTREHERQQAIAADQVEQRRQEQMLVRYVLIGAAIFIAVIIALTIIIGQLG